MNSRKASLGFQIVVSFSSVMLPWAAAHALEDRHAKVESVEGARTVLLQHGIGLREVSPGDPIEFGERIRTDEKTTVVIAYEDGSKLTILPNTDLEIQKPKGKIDNSELHSGFVRGAVEKAKDAGAPETGETPAKKPIHFVIRTKTATMGVRGTEFVAAYNAVSGLAQFNTLSGTVEVATSPAQLLGGVGTPIQSGQFIQATSEGLSAVRNFNPSSFLNSLGGAASSAGSGASGAAGGAASSAAGAATTVRVPTVSSAPPPKLPEAPPPPPLPPAAVAEKVAAEEAEKPHLHLGSFAIGAFMSQNPNPNNPTGITYYRALQIAWTPIIPLPVMRFIYLRGNFGGTFFEDYSLNNVFLVHDYQAFVGTSLLAPLFVEAGAGEQIWRNDNIDSGLVTANAGLIISQNGKWNRIYGGVSKFLGGNQAVEIHAGIGIQFF